MEDVNVEDGGTGSRGDIGPVSMGLIRGKPLAFVWPSLRLLPSHRKLGSP